MSEREKARLDLFSVFLTVPAFGGLVYGLSQIGGGHGGQSGGSTLSIIALGIGAISMLAFVLRQVYLQKSDAPLLDLRAFNFRMFTVSVLIVVIAQITLFGAAILLPMYLQEIRGLESLETGLALLPGGLAMGLLAPFIGRLFDKIGPVPLTVVGSIMMVLSLWQFSMLSSDTAVWWIIALHVVLCFGLALLFTPAFTTGLNPLPPGLYSHGAAIMSTLQQVAGAAGTALLVSIFASVSATSGLVAGMRAAFLTAMVVALVSIVLSVMLRKTNGTPQKAGRGGH